MAVMFNGKRVARLNSMSVLGGDFTAQCCSLALAAIHVFPDSDTTSLFKCENCISTFKNPALYQMTMSLYMEEYIFL